MFQTNSPVSRANSSESFTPTDEKARIGGRSAKALKNE